VKVARAQLRMTRAEGDAYLASQRWARVASVDQDGEPHVSPVGYVFLDGRIYFYGTEEARRTRDVRAGSRVSVCVDSGTEGGYSERRGVILYGVCRIVPEREPVRAAYARAQFGDSATDFRRRTHVWFEVEPYRRVSWDFGKIPPGADRFSAVTLRRSGT
jgi:nitroimidazol reductase NimA-like FMN-containing flavoprotein (pyridoxamine 5'-phosphate oxidase superfamily)